MKIFFSADLHAGHGNIAAYCRRPWLKETDLKTWPYPGEGKPDWVSREAAIACAERMNAALVRNWNSRVQPGDIVYHLGDFCCKGYANGVLGLRNKAAEYEAQLNGKIIHIRGNHDRNNGVKGALDCAVMELTKDTLAYLVHIPPQHPREVPDDCDVVLCGHVHDLWVTKWLDGLEIPIINVGTDVHKYAPVSAQEVKTILDRRVKGD